MPRPQVRFVALHLGLTLAFVFSGDSLGSAAAAPVAGPLRIEPWQPPAWSELAGSVRREIQRESDSLGYERARTDPECTKRWWRYRSDTCDVVAVECRPSRSAGPLPAIVFCRGSFVQNGLTPALLTRLHRLARAGFVVVAPQYRGSEGGTGRDEMGGADLEDVRAALRLVAADPGVDPRAVHLYGESRGGMMVLQALRDSAHVRSAATVGAFTDLDTLFRDDPRSAALAPRIWPDYAARATEIAERRSAARWANRIRVPLLILHGAEDSQALPRQAQALAAALERAGRRHELRIVPGAGHTLGSRAAWRDSLVVSWFGSAR